MSSLSDLQTWLASLVRDVAAAFGVLADSRGQLDRYTAAIDAPPIPSELADRLKALGEREPDLHVLVDIVDVVEGIRDAVRASNADLPGGHVAARVAEVPIRMFVPITLAVLRRGHYPFLGMLAEVVTTLDDKMANSLPGLTSTQYFRLFRRAVETGWEDQPARVLAFEGIPLLVYLLAKTWMSDELEHAGPILNAGWESPYRDRIYGRPQSWRDTPTWISQRTTSIHFAKTPSFTLDRYRTASPQPMPVLHRGLTIAPVPRTRIWPDPNSPAPFIANAGGPSAWIQTDVEGEMTLRFAKYWTLLLRGHGDAGFEVPLGDGADPLTGGAGGGVEAELTWTPDPPETDAPTTEGSEHGGASLSVQSVSAIGYIGGAATLKREGKLGIGVRATKLRLSITPSSGVLGALVNRSVSLTTDLCLMLTDQGLAFEGANGLDLYLGTKIPLPFGITLTYLRVTAINEKKQLQVQVGLREYDVETTELGAQLTAGLELAYLGIKLIVDGIGAKLVAQTNRPGGNVLGLGNLAGDLVLPSGIGLKIDLGFVRGGGFFGHDAQTDRYFGAIELGWGSANGKAKPGTPAKPKFVLRGVGFTEPRPPLAGETDSATTTLALLTGEFASWGLGAIVGTHRSIDLDALRAALASGATEALLFPQDPVGRTSQIVASLATLFPAAPANNDRHIIGLLGKYTWGAGFFTIKLGVIAEMSGPWKTVAWPTKLAVPISFTAGWEQTKNLLWIDIEGLIDYDAALDEGEFRFALRNSRLIGADFVGGGVLFKGDPIAGDVDSTRAWFGSAGGYHPSYYGGKGPGRAAVDKRCGISIKRGNNVELEIAAYFAKSPAGWHFGVYGHLRIAALGIEFDGKLWLDGLFHSLSRWTIDVGGSIALIMFGQTITELSLEGEWTHSDKVYFAGKVSFKVLWWTVSKHTEAELSDELGETSQASDVHALLAAALTASESFPNSTPGDVTLAQATRTGIWNAPEQPFAFVQKVAPLDMPIDRVDATTFDAPITLATGPVTISSSAQNKVPLLSEFSPAAFLDLDTDAALHAPLGELWPAGFEAGDAAVCGDSLAALAELEEIVVDRAHHAPVRRRFDLSGLVRAQFAASNGVPAPTPLRVLPARFASRLSDAPSTFGDAWSKRGTLVRRTENQG